MVRDLEMLNEAKKKNLDYYACIYRFRRSAMWNKAKTALEQGNKKRHDDIIKLRTELRLDTTYKSGLLYGNCRKFEKPVTFIPDTFQFETQKCFENRKVLHLQS